MKRRFLLGRTVMSVLSAGIFTATGWLMGARALTMPAPCPPAVPLPSGCCCEYTACTQVQCGGGTCNHTCVYCCGGGFHEWWNGCTNQSSKPCSSGFCEYGSSRGTIC